ncbi:MAG TPA: universal stress protein [Terriglobales bacterium]|nr:universal stress protein [Terriglobales bacterium]
MKETISRMELLESSSTSADALTLRNILMATDFSESSTRALNYALGIAARYAATLHLFHCIDPTPYNMGAPDAAQTAREAAWRDMQRLDSDLRCSGLAKNVNVKFQVEVAELPTILPDMVHALDLGLIVVGTHGRTGWKKLALGSVAETVVDHASCPVLVVGPYTDRNRLEQFGPESILFAYDASAHSKLAESYAFSLARKYSSRLSVAHVFEEHAGRVLARVSQFEWRDSELRDTALGRNITNLPQLPPEIGTQSDLILREAERAAADLIVLTVPAAHRFTNRFLSTNSYRVVCGAPCPVLTVRAG